MLNITSDHKTHSLNIYIGLWCLMPLSNNISVIHIHKCIHNSKSRSIDRERNTSY